MKTKFKITDAELGYLEANYRRHLGPSNLIGARLRVAYGVLRDSNRVWETASNYMTYLNDLSDLDTAYNQKRITMQQDDICVYTMTWEKKSEYLIILTEAVGGEDCIKTEIRFPCGKHTRVYVTKNNNKVDDAIRILEYGFGNDLVIVSNIQVPCSIPGSIRTDILYELGNVTEPDYALLGDNINNHL